ncbi:hypothetical protein JL720_1523 [Aureococcus anophagefferens]|nr:hypothetical protein JL720_1523 [Aureococcus anophagefferens]
MPSKKLYVVLKGGAAVRDGVELTSAKVGKIEAATLVELLEEGRTASGTPRARVSSPACAGWVSFKTLRRSTPGEVAAAAQRVEDEAAAATRREAAMPRAPAAPAGDDDDEEDTVVPVVEFVERDAARPRRQARDDETVVPVVAGALASVRRRGAAAGRREVPNALEAPPASSGASPNALEASLASNGESSYYYAHGDRREAGQDKSDSTSLQRECSARARSGKSIHASRPFQEMIARPKISRNEREAPARPPARIDAAAPSQKDGDSALQANRRANGASSYYYAHEVEQTHVVDDIEPARLDVQGNFQDVQGKLRQKAAAHRATKPRLAVENYAFTDEKAKFVVTIPVPAALPDGAISLSHDEASLRVEIEDGESVRVLQLPTRNGPFFRGITKVTTRRTGDALRLGVHAHLRDGVVRQ